MLFLPPDTEYIIETLQKNGYEAYAVGGCVRDMLNGDTPHDFDITTSAEPETVILLPPQSPRRLCPSLKRRCPRA